MWNLFCGVSGRQRREVAGLLVFSTSTSFLALLPVKVLSPLVLYLECLLNEGRLRDNLVLALTRHVVPSNEIRMILV